ncbi:uncharacterized protein BCR38DRAFT_523538 [Pseudomassariella vexata]|uniref:Uncharacterized protein n=1 Tax=Pseudomassariella vexata TaxID=1141098 RepID=A0A1Y2E0C3_9PEZI|nr:uncharacterized protein BCR38DRAFT_523538 [Pseudomassariella vexata]ORY64988.1 hypothetical protein BCR38DRAFT_523538 [Pseudomassariella vexata]
MDLTQTQLLMIGAILPTPLRPGLGAGGLLQPQLDEGAGLVNPSDEKIESPATQYSSIAPLDETPLDMQTNQERRERKPEYVAKGAFLVKKDQEGEFNFPKFQSQPEPSWRAGDGFSGDEANPDFIFFVTGKHKRKRRSKFMLGMPTLSMNETSRPSSCIRAFGKRRRVDEFPQHQRRGVCRGEKKDIWPTLDDFVESTLPDRAKRLSNRAENDDGNSVVFSRRVVKETQLEPINTMKYIPLRRRERGVLDFGFSRGNDEIIAQLARVRAWRNVESDEAEEAEYSDEGSQAAETDFGRTTDDEGPVGAAENSSGTSRSSSLNSTDTSWWDADGNHVFRGDLEFSQSALDGLSQDSEEE